MTVPPQDLSTQPTGDPSLPQPPSGWQRVVIVGIVAAVLVTVVIVTRSAEAVGIVVPPILLILGRISSGKGGRRE